MLNEVDRMTTTEPEKKQEETVTPDFEPGTCVEQGENLMKEDGEALMASLDEEIREGKPARKKKNKKERRWLKTLIWTVSVILAAAVIGYVGLTFALDFLGLKTGKAVDVNITKGMSASAVADALEEAGVIRSATMFRIYLKISKKGSDFKYGIYTLKPDFGYGGIIRKLSTEGMKAEAVRVTVPEGATIDEIAAILESKGVCTQKEFIKTVRSGEFDYAFLDGIPADVAYRLEGYLYPDTYEFFNYGGEECAYRAVDKMLANFAEHFTPEMIEKAKARGFSMHEITTMASIIEMEAGNASDTDRARVSAVFFNRLAWTDEPNFLGSTPTADYPYGNGRYDTNKTQGLPPGPLCSPSAASLKAAVEPMADFPYNYFVTDVDMKFYFNKTYAEHNGTIAKLKNEGLWAY